MVAPTITPYITLANADTLLAGSATWIAAATADKNDALAWGRVYLDSVYDVTDVDEDDPNILIEEANAYLADEHIKENLFTRQDRVSKTTFERVKAGDVESEVRYDVKSVSSWQDPFPQITALLFDVVDIEKGSVVVKQLGRA